MDLVSLIITLVLLAAVAAAAYFAYQKIVVEGGIFETTPTESIVSEPTSSLSTPGEVAGGVPGVDNMKGRPGSGAATTINYYGGGEKLVPDGDAKTASVCYEYSKALGLDHWGWDRKNKSCFAYLDGHIFTGMSTPTNIQGKSDYIVGCTQSGVQVLDGCKDLSKGNFVFGHKGGSSWGTDTGTKKMTPEACRAYANENGYDAFGYRTSRYNGDQQYTNTCFVYADAETNLKNFMGDIADTNHNTYCTDPSKKVIDGCQ